MKSDGPIKSSKHVVLAHDLIGNLSFHHLSRPCAVVCDGACASDVLVSVISLSLCFGCFTAHSAHAVHRDTKKHISPVVLHPRLF